MARGGFELIVGDEALLQCSWLGRPNLESVQVTPSPPSYAAMGEGGGSGAISQPPHSYP